MGVDTVWQFGTLSRSSGIAEMTRENPSSEPANTIPRTLIVEKGWQSMEYGIS